MGSTDFTSLSLLDLTRYMKSSGSETGTCGLGNDTQYFLYNAATDEYVLFTQEGDEAAQGEEVAEASETLNASFNQMAHDAVDAYRQRTGDPDAELTITLSDDRGLQLVFATPAPVRRRISIGRPTWLEAFLFVITFTAYRPMSMR